MKERLFDAILGLFAFWVTVSVFSGIEVQEGVLGYIVCGGLFGISMSFTGPLIKFFTLPVKAITLIMISLMLSVIVFFVYNFGLPIIDFADGEIIGLSNQYFDFPRLPLGMMGNILVGGMVTGLVYSLVKILEREVHKS